MSSAGSDEGTVKFYCEWSKRSALPKASLQGLIFWRQKLYDLGLIGASTHGVGYGNISIRYGRNFIITCTETGLLHTVDVQHFTCITAYDIRCNNLTCHGPCKASSESLSHAAIYASVDDINAVVHIHNKNLWLKYRGVLPTTNIKASCGTIHMAEEVKRLSNASKVIIMGGHRDGIITYGNSLDGAASSILNLYQAFHDERN